MVREYLRYWEILRTCCGPQSSKDHQEHLHGMDGFSSTAHPKRPSFALDSPHCDIYDLDAVEEALFNTSLWRWHWHLAEADFTMEKDQNIRRGVCCYSQLDIRNGKGFRGEWRPDDEIRAYLAAHGDPRDHRVDAAHTDAACAHRNYATDNADPVKCMARMRDGTMAPAGCPKKPSRPWT